MRLALMLGVACILLAGCGSSSAGGSPTATVTPAKAVAAPTPTRAPAPTPTITIGKPYRAFLASVCGALARGDAGAIISSLPYYQYNSGLRYGSLGDGEGQTSDPSLMRAWLSKRRVQCRYITPDVSGHGTVLTVGWQAPGTWSLIEMDIFQGHWKINDFTFGPAASLYRSMHVAGPILPYHA